MTIYLYVKQHSITGLKYFGRTQKRNPFKYLGSGIYWTSHYKEHGKEYIKTLEIWGFDNQDLCTQFALKFSKDNDIVKSEKWANLVVEDGKPHGLVWQCGDENYSRRYGSPNKGKKLSPEQKLKQSISMRDVGKGIPRSPEAIRKTAEKNRGKKRSLESIEKFRSNNMGMLNPSYGKKWITNGTINKLVSVSTFNTEYPDWKLGRTVHSPN